jgi:nucleoside-diphosphate kinase
MSDEFTFVLVKPGAVLRGQVGEILSRYERAGLRIDTFRFSGAMERKFWEDFYGDLKERIPEESYEAHIAYMCSGAVAPMTLLGANAVERVRTINGPTNPFKAPPGTVRGDLGRELPDNAVHASDSPESALREFEFWRPFLEG